MMCGSAAGASTAGSAAEQTIMHCGMPGLASFLAGWSGQCCIGIVAEGTACAAAGDAVMPRGINSTAIKAIRRKAAEAIAAT